MKATTYAEKLKDPRWQKKRLKILERDDWKCNYCGDDSIELQVHHLEYTNCDPWKEKEDSLVTVCSDCHGMITCLEKYKITVESIYKTYGDTGNHIMLIKHNKGYSFISKAENCAVIHNCEAVAIRRLHDYLSGIFCDDK